MFCTATLNNVFMPMALVREATEVARCAVPEVNVNPGKLSASWVMENGKLRMQWSANQTDRG